MGIRHSVCCPMINKHRALNVVDNFVKMIKTICDSQSHVNAQAAQIALRVFSSIEFNTGCEGRRVVSRAMHIQSGEGTYLGSSDK